MRKKDLLQLTINVLMPHWYALCMQFSHAALRKSEEKKHLMPVRIHQQTSSTGASVADLKVLVIQYLFSILSLILYSVLLPGLEGDRKS